MQMPIGSPLSQEPLLSHVNGKLLILQVAARVLVLVLERGVAGQDILAQPLKLNDSGSASDSYYQFLVRVHEPPYRPHSPQ